MLSMIVLAVLFSGGLGIDATHRLLGPPHNTAAVIPKPSPPIPNEPAAPRIAVTEVGAMSCHQTSCIAEIGKMLIAVDIRGRHGFGLRCCRPDGF